MKSQNIYDRKARTFRILAGVLIVYLGSMAAVTFYNFGRSTSDENWFRDPPSNVYVVRSIPVAAHAPERTFQVRVGDLLVSVNGREVHDARQADSALRSFSGDSLVHLAVMRPVADETVEGNVRRDSLATLWYRGIPPTAYVYDVIPGGASDQAGMKVGDLILRINGESFNNVNQADQILRRAQAGKAYDYQILRGNQESTLQVTVATFGLPIPCAFLIGAGILFMAVGGFLAMARPQFPGARLIGLSFLLLGFMLAVFLNRREVDRDFFVYARDATMIVAGFLGIAYSIRVSHFFPKERPEILSRKWIPVVLYALVLLGLVADFFFKDPAILPSVIALALFCLVIAFVFRKQRSAEYRKIKRVIGWTKLFVAVLSVAAALVLQLTSKGRNQDLGYLGVVFLFIPLSYLYTIGRYRLFDLDLRIRRTVQYSFASLAWGGASFVFLLWALYKLPRLPIAIPHVRLTGASIEIIDTPLAPQDEAFLQKLVLILVAIGLTFLLRSIGRGGQEFIARKFHRAKYDYRRAASELAEVMATRLTMADLARGIVERLADLMQLKRVGVLFFRSGKDCCCQEAHGFEDGAWKSFCMTVEEGIPTALQHFRGELSIDLLPPGIRNGFFENGFQYVIPIRSKEKLVGALLVGEKQSESAFRREDLEFLAAVANQASVAIENAFLYEELAEQERMKRELEVARKIQLDSLPQKTPIVKGLDMAGISVPALEVGGDYYDYLNGEVGKLTVIVGDVSGKGTSAALYMSKVQGIMRSLHGFGLEPRELFGRVNKLLCNDLEKSSFVTAMGGFFSTEAHQLVLARAGHLPLYHFKARENAVERVIPRGIGFGLDAEDAFLTELEERTIHYNTGDVFLFVTDGVTEAERSDGEQFGEERLEQLLRTHSSLSAEQIKVRVMAGVALFVGEAAQHDDQTLVVVKSV